MPRAFCFHIGYEADTSPEDQASGGGELGGDRDDLLSNISQYDPRARRSTNHKASHETHSTNKLSMIYMFFAMKYPDQKHRRSTLKKDENSSYSLTTNI